ncbi:Ribbon-helix-helix protein, copG family [Synechococcus sp. PCC 7335]|uniref:hypothetical protein n=1 Tax=Synechococcus sp. (strain ATCC 29403 / PCC 7335) TaxID=91464 RepID=UPI00017EB8E0|nr:hypothetical protein [Synechococcus sp. PCC 7335]EDX82928.1 Ribbon-helix-helix protein, copG family [Synechococcus sp. PCC 7335]EDX83413.1 Ribbon-helix-helix protein, copG family [Synechococcus sp. PCC 7335]
MLIVAKTDPEELAIPERPSLVSSYKAKRGRPPTLSEERKRKRRNVSISDTAWDRLDKLANDLGYTSKSELLEKIGRREVELSHPESSSGSSSLKDILIYRRIMGLFDPHGDVLRSLVGFNYAISQKLPQKENKAFSELLSDNLLTSLSVIFQHCYIRPDRYVNSISALSRLINYCLLLNQAGLADEWFSDQDRDEFDNNSIESKKVEGCLNQIGYGMSHLKDASFSHQLTALRLKYIGGFTEAQIQQIYALQGMAFTIEQIRSLVHEGWFSFRSHWSQTIETEPDKEPDIEPDAQKYCKLLWSSSLESAESRKALLRIILKATYDAPLNFWLCEIEHKWRTEFLGRDEGLENELSQLQAEIQDRISERFEERKQAIDRNMHYCLNRSAAVDKLVALFEEDTEISSKTKLGTFVTKLLQAEPEGHFAQELTAVLDSSDK